MNELKTRALFTDPDTSLAYPYLCHFEYPWEALGGLADMIRAQGDCLSHAEYEERAEGVWIARSARVDESAHLSAPCIVCAQAEIRSGAFVRGGVMIGRGAVVGNSTELKNCVLFDGAAVPHFNYVGDSILGYRAHFGAGVITSNVKSDKTPVSVAYGGKRVDTGRKKFGAAVGDLAEVGCNTVLNPGTVIGRMSRVYPLSSVRGYVPALHIYKREGALAPIE